MIIEKSHIVSIHYILKGDDGEIIDQSKESPLTYLQGGGQIVPGLEKALEGRKQGDRVSVAVSPQDGYGQSDPAMLTKVSLEQLSGIPNLQIGQQIQADTPQGPIVFRVSELHEDHAILDANHPMAGKNLHFDIEIVKVRLASEKELKQGQACNTGCCD